MPRSPKFAAPLPYGIYDIRGGDAKCKLPHFDDLLFLGASISRNPLEGYREKCGADVTNWHPLCLSPVGAQLTLYRISTVNWDCRARYKA